jgi:predicted dehydrogenase
VAFTESAGLPVECFVNISARLANGVLLSITSADAVPQGVLSGDRHIMIVGDDGVLTDDSEGSIWVHLGGERKKLEAEAPDLTKATAFVSAIEGSENLSPAIEGAYAVALTEAAYRSAAEGRIVRVDLH